MRGPIYATAIAAMVAGIQPSAALEQCLTVRELQDVAHMGAVMGIGGGLRRCGHCLGERYQSTVDKYETTGMLVEFRRSESAIQSTREKFEYADNLVRTTARKYAGDISADCRACEQSADLIASLSSEEARTKLYGDVAETITKLPSYRKCP